MEDMFSKYCDSQGQLQSFSGVGDQHKNDRDE